ncbi:hypothetical protein VitviT2T_012735 [Vitis vinifera]|uniref:Secreted protein n=2 Tax=Vitis vinifera TaxID=29760 RepID=A0ABY9CEY6_VITVI
MTLLALSGLVILVLSMLAESISQSVQRALCMISVRNTTWSKLYMGPGNPEPSLILVWISKWALELLVHIISMS